MQHKQTKKLMLFFLLWHATRSLRQRNSTKDERVRLNIENFNDLKIQSRDAKYWSNMTLVRYGWMIWRCQQLVCLGKQCVCVCVWLGIQWILDIPFGIQMGPLSAIIICNTEIYWRTQFMDFRCETQRALNFRLVEYYTMFNVHKMKRKLNKFATLLIFEAAQRAYRMSLYAVLCHDKFDWRNK